MSFTITIDTDYLDFMGEQGLSPTTQIVFLTLRTYTKSVDYYPSVSRMSQRLKMSRVTIYKALEELQDKHFIVGINKNKLGVWKWSVAPGDTLHNQWKHKGSEVLDENL